MSSDSPQKSALTKTNTDALQATLSRDTSKSQELRGYLKKKSKQDKWQKRWFEANDHYLTYYKTPQSKKLLACIDLYQTGEIKPVSPMAVPGDKSTEFSISLGDRYYIIKSETREDALRWVEGLRQRQVPPTDVPPASAGDRSSSSHEQNQDDGATNNQGVTPHASTLEVMKEETNRESRASSENKPVESAYVCCGTECVVM